MDTALGFGHRHALNAVHAGLVLQPEPRVLTFDEIDGLIQAALFGLAFFDDFELPAP